MIDVTKPIESAKTRGFYVRPTVNGGIVMEIGEGAGHIPEIASFTTPKDFIDFIKNAYEVQ